MGSFDGGYGASYLARGKSEEALAEFNRRERRFGARPG